MASSTNLCKAMRIVSFSLLLLACIIRNAMHVNADGRLQGMLIFGSSVVDNGNNNFNPGTTAKANYKPYGVDFPSGATGRFSNGKNIADVVAEHLGLPVIPPFADPNTKGAAIAHGVNFGSGGSGILNETGSFVGKVTTLNQQIGNFETVTLPALESQLGCQRATLLPNFLFMIAAGNNDYLLNYFLGQQLSTPQDFAANLVSSYLDQIKRLYNLGARKFLLVSVYPLGCSPVVSHGSGCLPVPNGVVVIFYDQLVDMVNGLKQQLAGSDFVVVNSVKIITDIISNPGAAGFTKTNGPCCQLSLNGASCQENGSVCNDRKGYVYFDGQHNTEALNTAFVAKAYASNDDSDVYPINLRKLVHAHF